MSEILANFRFMGRLFASALRDGFMFPIPFSASFLPLVQQDSSPKPSAPGRAPVFFDREIALTSLDLPRNGFLAGEVFAAEHYVCRALDRIDSLDPPLSRTELQKRYRDDARDVASDKSFTRVALGKNYTCSFEEYFQDRTFVDPLDPTQGADAVPLCTNGYRKPVTIYNVREWVELAMGCRSRRIEIQRKLRSWNFKD